MKFTLCKIRSLHSKLCYSERHIFLSVFQAQHKKVEIPKVAYICYFPATMMNAYRTVRETIFQLKGRLSLIENLRQLYGKEV